MKKITLLCIGILLSLSAFAQNYTTELIQLIDDGEDINYSAQIDMSDTTVTLTLSGPDGRFFGFGFGEQSMTSGGDAVIFLKVGTDYMLTDRSFGYPGQPDGEDATGVTPKLDASQDWTLVSNTLVGAQRTIVATRLLDTGDVNDYVFSTSDISIDLVFSLGFSYTLGYHGDNRGMLVQPITTLNQDDFTLNNVKLFPNPSNSMFNLKFSEQYSDLQLEAYDVLGKQILSRKMDRLNSNVDVSTWNNGVYIIKVTSNGKSIIKNFIKG